MKRYIIRVKYTATDNNPGYKPGTTKVNYFGRYHKQVSTKNTGKLVKILVEYDGFQRKGDAIQSLRFYNELKEAEEMNGFWNVEITVLECDTKDGTIK